jgi:hypothetical protein
VTEPQKLARPVNALSNAKQHPQGPASPCCDRRFQVRESFQGDVGMHARERISSRLRLNVVTVRISVLPGLSVDHQHLPECWCAQPPPLRFEGKSKSGGIHFLWRLRHKTGFCVSAGRYQTGSDEAARRRNRRSLLVHAVCSFEGEKASAGTSFVLLR